MAVSVRPPAGSVAMGMAPPFAWGAPSGVADVLNLRDGTDYRGDLLIHQGKAPGPDLNMKFRAEDIDQFPRGCLLGLAVLKDVLPPTSACGSKWADDGYFHWVICWPRPFRQPIRWHGQPGLFEVHSPVVRRAIDEANYEARRTWRSLPESDREWLLEMAGKLESDGAAPGAASRSAIEQFQWMRALRNMDQARGA